MELFKFFKRIWNRFKKRKKVENRIKEAAKDFGKRIENFENIWKELSKRWEKENMPKSYHRYLENWVEKELPKKLRTCLLIHYNLKKSIEDLINEQIAKLFFAKKPEQYIKTRIIVDYLERLLEKIKNKKDAKNFLESLSLDEFIKYL